MNPQNKNIQECVHEHACIFMHVQVCEQTTCPVLCCKGDKAGLSSPVNHYTKLIVTSERSATSDDVCVYVYRMAERKYGLPIRLEEGCLTHTHTQG